MSSKKHVMLSYQWDNQELVKEIHRRLTEKNIPLWMDIQGGMKGHLSESMAEGVENAAAICCFLTPKYQDSVACKDELTYAKEQGVCIIPILAVPNWKPTGWLGFTIAGHKWINFRDINTNMNLRVEQLIAEIQLLAGKQLGCFPDMVSSPITESQTFAISTNNIVQIVRWKCPSNIPNQTRYFYEPLTTPMGPGWQWDGIIFRAYTTQEPGTDPVYGYHSEVGGAWHNTIQMDPAPPLSPANQWVWDGVKFYAFKTSMNSEKLKPVRRYWSESNGNSQCFCLLTMGTEDIELPGYTFDKIVCFALPPE